MPAEGPGRPSAGDGDRRLDAALRAIAAERYGDAESLVTAVRADWPQCTRARFLGALADHKRRLYEKAAAQFESLVAEGPSFPGWDSIYNFLGWARYHTGRLEIARESFERHLRASPESADSWFGLGLVELDGDRVDAARRALEKAVELESGKPQRRQALSKVWARLADVSRRAGDLDRARRELQSALEAWPENERARYKLSRIDAAPTSAPVEPRANPSPRSP